MKTILHVMIAAILSTGCGSGDGYVSVDAKRFAEAISDPQDPLTRQDQSPYIAEVDAEARLLQRH